jgi:hypothetical protein
MTVVAAPLMSVTVMPASPMGLRRLMGLWRRSLRMRLRLRAILRARSFHALLRLWLRTVFHPWLRLRLHRAVLYPWSFHPRLGLRHRSILNVRLRLWPVLEPRLCVGLRLHRAILTMRGLDARLRLWLRPILKPRICAVRLWLPVLKRRIGCVGLRLRLPVLKRRICRVRLRLRLPVLKRGICRVRLRLRLPVLKGRIGCVRLRLRLRPVLEAWVAIGLWLRDTIVHARLVSIRLPMGSIGCTLIHIRRVGLCGTAFRPWTAGLNTARSRSNPVRIRKSVLREGL